MTMEVAQLVGDEREGEVPVADLEAEIEEELTLEQLLQKAIRFMKGILVFSVCGIAAAFVCIAALGVVIWTIDNDNKQDEYEDCLTRQDGREAVRSGILEGSLSNARTLIAVTGSEDDPRAAALLAQTNEDLRELLDELLPPIECVRR